MIKAFKVHFILIMFLALFLLIPYASAQESVYTIGETTAVFGEQGQLTRLFFNGAELVFDGIYADIGLDGTFAAKTVYFQKFHDMSTWELANIVPLPTSAEAATLKKITQEGNTVTVVTQMEQIQTVMRYVFNGGQVSVDATFTNLTSYVGEVQGVNFLLRGIKVNEDATFSYPGNVPYKRYSLADLKNYRPIQTGLVGPVTQVTDSVQSFNVLFLNPDEKWTTGTYKTNGGTLNIAHLSMTEALLKSGESIHVGTMTLQLCTGGDVYAPIRAYYDEMGYAAPQTGIVSGPIYSGHPHGTMDSGFRDNKTMLTYAGRLTALADMGIENIWLLPIFEHTGRGVYSPTDQAVIDPRYGSDADVRAYVQSAHDLGIRVLFDYVPHGPEPQDPLAAEHPAWCSVHRQGRLQIEWDCVSFDMANPDYQAYTKALVEDHVARFAIDGGRIDCAMGGLSNWQPTGGNRPSNSNMKGGVEIVTAIREGFIAAGKTPLLLPENFNPLPFYASITDVFYDMPLYRAMYEMRQAGLSETAFAQELSRWLCEENAVSPRGQKKLRFLGNHDTVSWVWDKMRATSLYGEEKAKALWVVMSLIDGYPFIYQGDEDAGLYAFPGGPKLTAFFTALFNARKTYLSDDMATCYYPNDSAIIAFTRENESLDRLALINLSAQTQTFELAEKFSAYQPLYGQAVIESSTVTLSPYAYILLGD